MDLSKISQPKETPKTKGQLLKDAFRSFLNDKWYEHQEELINWEKKYPEYDREYYFKKHKWLLKKMFKEEAIETFRKQNERRIAKELKRGFKKGNL